MPKNPQKSVDSISDMRFHVGMDAREMKKWILYYAMDELAEKDEQLILPLMLDQDYNEISKASIDRYRQLLMKMLDKASEAVGRLDIEYID